MLSIPLKHLFQDHVTLLILWRKNAWGALGPWTKTGNLNLQRIFFSSGNTHNLTTDAQEKLTRLVDTQSHRIPFRNSTIFLIQFCDYQAKTGIPFCTRNICRLLGWGVGLSVNFNGELYQTIHRLSSGSHNPRHAIPHEAQEELARLAHTLFHSGTADSCRRLNLYP